MEKFLMICSVEFVNCAILYTCKFSSSLVFCGDNAETPILLYQLENVSDVACVPHRNQCINTHLLYQLENVSDVACVPRRNRYSVADESSGSCHLQSACLILAILGKNLYESTSYIKSFYSWSTGHPWRASRHCCLQMSPWPCSMVFLWFLFHHFLSFATFCSAYLSFYIPEHSNLVQFSLLLLFLYVMCVQSNSIFFFLSDFLLTSDGWLSIVCCSWSYRFILYCLKHLSLSVRSW